MAKLSFAIVPIAVVAAAILFPFAVTSADKASGQATSITISELNKLQVIGWLGQPLGKIVTIEGVVTDDYYRKMKVDAGQTLLRVQAVDGKKLPGEQIVTVLSAGVEKPKVGSKFKYIGYETGGFTGVPREAFRYMQPVVATTGYYFTTDFVVVREAIKQE